VGWAEVEVGLEGEHATEHGVEVEDAPERKGKRREEKRKDQRSVRRLLEGEGIDSPEHPPSNLSVGTLTALAGVVELSLLDQVGSDGGEIPGSSESVESSEMTCEESEGLD